MWTESKKWKEMRANGGHGVVRFDVFCGHCNKQIGEDVASDRIGTCGLRTEKPMETFCDCQCAADWQAANGQILWSYGWRPTIPMTPNGQSSATADTKQLREYVPGGGCRCAAANESECGCGVDWTPTETHRLRAKLRMRTPNEKAQAQPPTATPERK